MRLLKSLLALAAIAFLVVLAGCGADPAFTSGKVYLQDQNYAKAIEQLQFAIRNSPKAYEPHMFLGRAFADLAAGSGDQPVKFKLTANGEEKKYDVKPGQTDVLLPLAHDQFFQALELAVEPAAKEAVENTIRSYWAVYRNKGVSANEAQKFEDAVPEFEKAIVVDDRQADAYINLGFSLHMSGNEDRAIEIFERALEYGSDNPTLKENLVSVYQAKAGELASAGDYENALLYFEKIQRVAPDTPDIAYNIGLMYYQMTEYREALMQFGQQLEASPDDEEVLYRIFLAHWALSTKFDNDASIAPNDEAKAASTQAAQDEYTQALQPLLKLIELNNEEVTYHRALARVYNKLGRNEEAMNELKEVEVLLRGGDLGEPTPQPTQTQETQSTPETQETQTQERPAQQ